MKYAITCFSLLSALNAAAATAFECQNNEVTMKVNHFISHLGDTTVVLEQGGVTQTYFGTLTTEEGAFMGKQTVNMHPAGKLTIVQMPKHCGRICFPDDPGYTAHLQVDQYDAVFSCQAAN